MDKYNAERVSDESDDNDDMSDSLSKENSLGRQRRKLKSQPSTQEFTLSELEMSESTGHGGTKIGLSERFSLTKDTLQEHSSICHSLTQPLLDNS